MVWTEHRTSGSNRLTDRQTDRQLKISVSQTGVILTLGGHLEMSGDVFDCQDSEQGAFWAWRLEMLLIILPCTGQAPDKEWPGPKCH